MWAILVPAVSPPAYSELTGMRSPRPKPGSSSESAVEDGPACISDSDCVMLTSRAYEESYA